MLKADPEVTGTELKRTFDIIWEKEQSLNSGQKDLLAKSQRKATYRNVETGEESHYHPGANLTDLS